VKSQQQTAVKASFAFNWERIMNAKARKLSSMDASFLYLETPETPMHVGSMAIFRLKDGYEGDFFEEFKAMIAERLHIAPILKSRLAKTPLDIDHPSWVEDEQFDIDRHIFRAGLPAPHDRAMLERTVGWMHAKLLNRARPLWEFYVFEGMQNNEIGLYSKMHHACIDGGAGAALTAIIYDSGPVPRKMEKPTAEAKAAKEPREIAADFLDSYQQILRQPFDMSVGMKGLDLPRSGKSDLGSILFDNAMMQIEGAAKFAGNLPSILKSISEMASKISDPKVREGLSSMISPSTILNKSISSERSFAAVSISLPEAKAVAKQAGGKLNDVVMALSSGVLRRYLLEKGALPTRSLTAAVPISLREEGNAEANNQAFGMVCSLASNIEDPKERLHRIIEGSTKSEEMSHPLRALMPQVSNLSFLGAPVLVQILALLYSRSDLSDVLPPSANVTISNVPGPRQTLYAVGAELLNIFPVSIASHSLALNITVQSYRDRLDFGFIAGANVIPQVQLLANMLPGELELLTGAFAAPELTKRVAN
jgi:diacylglycerol O-acyltransferase / wax synthase